ncbi:hypothetical protein KCP73_10965 [Salmonella enterica subsp. enterica]|nr:hypothetical protein KCP73_10965 [Salmonella enterica subsp. enterica]
MPAPDVCWGGAAGVLTLDTLRSCRNRLRRSSGHGETKSGTLRRYALGCGGFMRKNYHYDGAYAVGKRAFHWQTHKAHHAGVCSGVSKNQLGYLIARNLSCAAPPAPVVVWRAFQAIDVDGLPLFGGEPVTARGALLTVF